MTKKLTVLLVDDHTVVRAGFRMLLSSQDFIGEIIDVDRGELACQQYQTFKPDVVMMDLSMPGIGGLEAIRRLCLLDPDAVILVYSIHDEIIYVERALNAGAKGYVSKNSAAEVLAEAVLAVASGKRYVESGLLPELQDVRKDEVESLRAVVDVLSPREFDVFCLLAKGLTAHEVAADLCLGYKTVANYNTQIKNKLNVSNAAELAYIAMTLGIIKTN
ncbi:MAG: response regulator transcription factor [Gammaproteobacteria bacterium]|nr:response regulator transcription factor [Gammaproteobacteria bacterium]MDT8371363.1 response regulator transcription factor [Gammaproteobacteria bacterium]